VNIDHASWQRLSPLLDEALDLPAEQRTQWLAELRGRDPELAEEVEALLDEARAIGDERFLEHTPEGPERATLAGQTIGACVELRKAPPVAAEDERRLVRVQAHAAADELRKYEPP